MDHSAKNPGRVFYRLAASQLNILLSQKQHATAQFTQTNLKTDSGPSRRFAEDQNPTLASHEIGAITAICFESSSVVQQFDNLLLMTPLDGKKMLHEPWVKSADGRKERAERQLNNLQRLLHVFFFNNERRQQTDYPRPGRDCQKAVFHQFVDYDLRRQPFPIAQ